MFYLHGKQRLIYVAQSYNEILALIATNETTVYCLPAPATSG